MKFYACKKTGKITNIAKSTDFKGIGDFDAENCALKANKVEKGLFAKIGVDIEKDHMDGGCMWIEGNQLKQIRDKLLALLDLKPTEQILVNNITKYMRICIEKGYGVRVY